MIDKIFEVDEVVVFKTQIVRNMIEDVGVGCPMPLLNVSMDISLQM